jgi:hypothetical protein
MDYVYEIEDVLPKEICEIIIKRYDKDSRKEESAVGKGGVVDKEIRRSKVLPFSRYSDWGDVDCIIKDVISESITKYAMYIAETFRNTKLVDRKHLFKQMKDTFASMEDEGYFVQEYKEGDFYEWHVDHSKRMPNQRTLSFVLYLNTLNENQGGCTEFINGKKVRPIQGNMVVFPSDWQHLHRGAPVKNDGVKYTIGTWAV